MRNLKKVLALVLAMAMSLSLAVTAGAAFKDDDQIAAKYATAVEFAAQTGILEGFEDGTYGPQKNLTRAQLATMTYRIATGDVDDVYTADFAGGAAAAFTDTAATAWYAGYVGYAADAGYLKGVGDNLYKPNSAMTGYQALAAFLRVVGYNQPGQFTGADWTVQVAMIANEIGALEGISNVDLNAAISREVAAQIIFNILFSDKVDYTPAFGYQNALFEGSLAEDVFGIVKYDAAAVTEPWGQPAQEWYVKDGSAYEAVVSIPYAPVAEYTAAVSECDLAKDLGLTKTVKAADLVEYKNGGTDGVVFGDLNPLKVDEMIGAQGTLTEVYEVEGKYWFVQIETWLGQITETKDAQVDKNGHVFEAARAWLNVFDDCRTHKNLDDVIKTDAFEKDDYVLVNYSEMTEEYFLEETTPVATGVLTQRGINGNEFSVIGGETYDWADHYHLCNETARLDHKYDVFVDFYGNVIGLVEVIDEVEEFFSFFESYISVPGGHNNTHIEGRFVDPATLEVSYPELAGNAQWVADRTVKFVHDFVKYTVADNGEYEVTSVGTEYNSYNIIDDNANIVVTKFVKGRPVVETIQADAETIFLVEKECDDKDSVYETYVGYKAVPAMFGNGELEVYYDADEDDGFADYIYVNAENAYFPGEAIEAYIMRDCKAVNAGVGEATYVTFTNVVIDGEVTSIACKPGVELDDEFGMVKLMINAKTGLVDAVAPVVPAYVFANVEKVSGDLVDIQGPVGAYDASDALIWVVDESEGTCVVGTVADIEAGDNIYYQLDGANYEHIIVFA